jgi:hypothetical protein
VFLFELLSQEIIAQTGFHRPNEWKKYRKELVGQVGISQFLGDLGGLDKEGTDFSPADFDFKSTRPAITVGYRYKIYRWLNWHSSLNYLNVAGNDKFTNEIYRNNRNLNFKSNIFELSTRLELSFFSNKVSNKYGIYRTLNAGRRLKAWELIGFIGVGGFYFNPKGKNPVTGKYMKLQRLHTEGQGLPGGPKQYKRVAVCIPIGIAFRILINKYWNAGVEFNYRKTFTDYIDDVSTVYYDKAALEAAYGPNSVLMSDPSKGAIYGATSPDSYGVPAQRGDIEKDAYSSFQITVGRFIMPKSKKSRLRSKF